MLADSRLERPLRNEKYHIFPPVEDIFPDLIQIHFDSQIPEDTLLGYDRGLFRHAGRKVQSTGSEIGLCICAGPEPVRHDYVVKRGTQWQLPLYAGRFLGLSGRVFWLIPGLFPLLLSERWSYTFVANDSF